MSIAQSLLPEFDNEIATTRRVLERVPEDKFGWKPHEKSYSLGDLANHVARLSSWAVSTLKETELDVADFPPPEVADTVDGVLAILDETSKAARAAIEAASDEDFMVQWSLKVGGETKFAAPRVAVLRSFVLNHLIHHRAQLTVYLRLNDVPLPQVYGPTADESDM